MRIGMEIGVLALFVSVLALLAVPDLDIAWRRLKLIVAAAVVLVVLLLVASLLQAFVLPFTSRYLYLPDGVLWPFLVSLAALGVLGVLYDRFWGKKPAEAPEPGMPEPGMPEPGMPEPEMPMQGYDPGDYKTGW